ncbi:hypothetical protein E1B28_009640 [Marasmius oreades]|uniref:Enoyl reductase (ER) domain-containing protein n=1 Tax=Marasmius oreades TaxID=181124 RepID=A0A9P7RWM1_9AGAR|nr:uncharacterized protein E1B28_009640 [Marasmius oreades]KAG7090531.1 hypothetical protein E1B28_009640 [Marasmius oreades]
MPQQKALAIPSQAAPYTLISKPIPTPGPSEVLVKIEGIALGPLESKLPSIPSALDMFGPYPIFTGTDAAGVVEQVGENVKRLKKGDRVVFQGWFLPDYTSFQQYAVADENIVVKLPSTISTLEASSILVSLVTAAFGFALPNPATPSLTETAKGFNVSFFLNGRAGAGIKPFWEEGAKGTKSGEPIVIFGGSSSVGQFAIQIAKHLGYSPIITTSSLKHTDYLKHLGATDVIERTASAADIRDLAQGKQFNTVFDAVGVINQAYVDLLAPQGTFIVALPVSPDLEFRDGRKAANSLGAAHVFKELGLGLMEKLEGLLESGVIQPNRVEKVSGGLAGIPGAVARLQKEGVSGVKLVVDPRETP